MEVQMDVRVEQDVEAAALETPRRSVGARWKKELLRRLIYFAVTVLLLLLIVILSRLLPASSDTQAVLKVVAEHIVGDTLLALQSGVAPRNRNGSTSTTA
jgi:uncharacterized membrane-anchored protein